MKFVLLTFLSLVTFSSFAALDCEAVKASKENIVRIMKDPNMSQYKALAQISLAEIRKAELDQCSLQGEELRNACLKLAESISHVTEAYEAKQGQDKITLGKTITRLSGTLDSQCESVIIFGF